MFFFGLVVWLPRPRFLEALAESAWNSVWSGLLCWWGNSYVGNRDSTSRQMDHRIEPS